MSKFEKKSGYNKGAGQLNSLSTGLKDNKY